MYSNIYNTMSQTNSNKGNNEWGKPNEGDDWSKWGEWKKWGEWGNPDKEILDRIIPKENTEDWGEWDPNRKFGSDEIAKINAEWNKPKKKMFHLQNQNMSLKKKKRKEKKRKKRIK